MIIQSIVCICPIFLLFITNTRTVSIPNNTTYVGCYDTTLGATDSYMTVVKPVLTWEICVSLCFNQLTIFAGIDTKNFTCFCGNHIAELAAATEDCKCNWCHEDDSKYCGGLGHMSVYRLRAKTQTPTTLLLATSQGIEVFQYSTTYENDSHYQIESLQLLNSGATSIAYNFLSQDIYFVSSNKIFKMAYVPVLMKYYHPVLLIETNCTHVVDLSLDWVHEKIYWACYSSRKIQFANFDGSNVQEPISSIYELQHIRIEPFANSLFYETQKKLVAYNISRSSYDILNEFGFKETLQIAIDVQQETVYIIGSYSIGGSKKYLVSTNYKSTVFKIVYSGPGLVNAFALDAFNGTVIWGSKNSTDCTLYSGTMSSKWELENIKIIYSGKKSVKNINHLKIYGSEVQLPGMRYLCEEKNCSHTCRLLSARLAQCSCPESMMLSEDSRTCIDSSDLPTSTSETDYISSTITSTQVNTSTKKNHEHDNTVFVLPTNPSLKPDQQESYKKLFYVAIGVCVPILTILVVFQVYVCMMMKKSNGNFIFGYSKRSALDDRIYMEPNRSNCNAYIQ